MTRGFMRNIALAVAVTGIALSAPASAQMFREGYEFLKAVKDRDGEVVTQFLNEPGSTLVNTRDITSGETALHMVTARRDLTWVKFLLQNGANPNIRDKAGIAPIQVAVRLGFIDGVEELLKRGAEIEVNDSAGETPLIAAVHRRDVPLVRLLLANKANPDRTDNSGRSARDYAQLMSAGSSILDEFERADAEREESGGDKNYGPSF